MMTMDYAQALEWLNGFICYERASGWKYGPGAFDLTRFHRLLKTLGSPQLRYPTIHLAGSDGKGSTAAILASILREAGCRVGLYTSPHLEDIRERIVVNGAWITPEEFARQVPVLQTAMGASDAFPKSFATFFELLTALAFLHFQAAEVDVAVIETGLGGRLDATNVLNPDLTVITHLSLEHIETLGDTLEQIAAEKLAICHPGVPAIVANQKPEVMPFIRSWLEERQVPYYTVENQMELIQSHCDGFFRRITARDRAGVVWAVQLPLLGHYQVDNTLSALLATRHLPRFSEPLGATAWADAVKRGCERVVWPGRYEVLEAGTEAGLVRVVLDGAHTARGARTLRETLDEVEGTAPRTLLLGFLQGKKVEEMCQALIRPEDTVFLTKAPTPRGLTVDEIIEMCQSANVAIGSPKVNRQPDSFQACLEAMDDARRNGRTLVIAGSLYLVGACRSALRSSTSVRDGRRSAA